MRCMESLGKGSSAMPESQKRFEIDFDSYILQTKPSKQEKGKLWQTAIGLQQVDGLTP